MVPSSWIITIPAAWCTTTRNQPAVGLPGRASPSSATGSSRSGQRQSACAGAASETQRSGSTAVEVQRAEADAPMPEGNANTARTRAGPPRRRTPANRPAPPRRDQVATAPATRFATRRSRARARGELEVLDERGPGVAREHGIGRSVEGEHRDTGSVHIRLPDAAPAQLFHPTPQRMPASGPVGTAVVAHDSRPDSSCAAIASATTALCFRGYAGSERLKAAHTHLLPSLSSVTPQALLTISTSARPRPSTESSDTCCTRGRPGAVSRTRTRTWSPTRPARGRSPPMRGGRRW